MGAYNTLITKVKCQSCHRFYKARIQFKFRDTWQFEYNIGDKITWGENAIGKPNLPKVKAYGVVGSIVCPYCGYNNGEGFDIYIEKDVIKRVSPLSDLQDYQNDEDGNFFVYA